MVMLATGGAHKRSDAKEDVTWHVAVRPDKRKALHKENCCLDALTDLPEKIKAGIRAKGGQAPFQIAQTPVWPQQGALPGGEEEHGAAQDAACAVKPVDGALCADGGTGTSASANRAKTAEVKNALSRG